MLVSGVEQSDTQTHTHIHSSIYIYGFPGWLSGKEPACQCRRCGCNPWVKTIHWKRKWQPTPVFSSGESHGQGSLAGYSPQDLKESDTTEQPNDILFWILFHYRLLQVLVLHSRSLLSVLYIIMCIRSSQTPNFSPSIPRIRFGNHKFVSCDSISVL